MSSPQRADDLAQHRAVDDLRAVKLMQLPDTQAWAEAIAQAWCARLNAQPALHMCLPAGHTPTPVYAQMTRAVAGGRVSFHRATAFLLDEYGGLRKDDPGRCANMLRTQLLDGIDLPAQQFVGLDADAADLDALCRAHDQQLAQRPLDLAILGIGTNGHLGMNEPGTAADSLTRRVALHASTVAASGRYLTHAHLPTWGVTIGMKALLEAREVWLLATGEHKAAVIEHTLHGEISSAVPASLLRTHPNCVVWLDAEAASRL